jgi:hypothetical protein
MIVSLLPLFLHPLLDPFLQPPFFAISIVVIMVRYEAERGGTFLAHFLCTHGVFLLLMLLSLLLSAAPRFNALIVES